MLIRILWSLFGHYSCENRCNLVKYGESQRVRLRLKQAVFATSCNFVKHHFVYSSPVTRTSSLNLESPINTGLSGFFFCSNVPVGLIRGSYWVLFSHTVLSLIKSAITFIALTFAACTACV